MTTKTKLVKVSSGLEIELLAAVVRGACSPSIVNEKEISKVARVVHRAITDLGKQGIGAPFSLSTVYIHAISNLGAPEQETKDFLRHIQSLYKTTDHKALIKIAKEKEALVGILNEASKQLSSGEVELRKFGEITEKHAQAGEELKSLADLGEGEPPMGIELASLPTISDAARGVQGVWVIGGFEGIGKSTLGLQIAIELQQHLKVLYYDVDGTGEIWMRYRIQQAVGKERYKDASANIFYRGTISSLDSDLISVPAPAAIVVDSIQTLPYDVNLRRSSVDRWLNTFKALTGKGYTVLIISELSREGDYKESSGINYAGALNMVLESDDGGDSLRVLFKKNRHGPKKGHITTLTRSAQYPYWLEEV